MAIWIWTRTGVSPLPRTTDMELAWARTGKKPIYAVRWSFNHARIVRTKRTEANEVVSIWKKWKERQGWIVKGNVASGFFAYRDGAVEVCALRVYDP